MPRPPIDPLLHTGASNRQSSDAPRSFDRTRPRRVSIRTPNRRLTLVTAGILAILAVLVAVIVSRGEDPPSLQPVIPVDGWVPYWVLDDSTNQISQRAGSMREISPFWFKATGIDQIVQEENASSKLTKKFLKKTKDALVVPSIVDGTADNEMAAILANPVTRRQHIEAIVEFVQDGDFDGIELNYEKFAFDDGRDSWESTRPNWVSFVAELADELHSDGRTLTVAVPPVYDTGRTADSGYWVYDYGAIVEHVDHIRIMAYNFSTASPGPIAPLEWVQTTIDAAIAVTGRPDKLVLGIPTFGFNWPVSTAGVCPEPNVDKGIDIPKKTSVSIRSVDELIERRTATPVYDQTTAEWSFDYELEISDGISTCVQTRQVHYVDADGIRARMDLAIRAGLGGIALWALGSDNDEVWDAILIDATLPDSDSLN